MKSSVSILFCLFIGSILIAITTCERTHSSKSKTIVLSVTTSSWIQDSSVAYLPVTAMLSNNTSSDTSFLIMSCSWDEFFEIDTKELSLLGWDCNKNVPERVRLSPNSTKRFELKLKSDTGKPKFGSRFRVGFNWLPVSDGDDIINKYLQSREVRNMIWTDILRAD